MYVWKEHADARNSKKCVSFWRKLQILMPNIVYFYFKIMVVLEIGDIISEGMGAKGYNLKYGYVIEY